MQDFISKVTDSNVYLKLKKLLFGTNNRDGILLRILIYILLIGIGYIFLYPILRMLVDSFKSLDDLLNPLVNWIPTQLYMENYTKANAVLDFWTSLLQSLYVTALPSLMQIVVAAFVGYGLARYNFSGKNVLMGLIVATFIIPPQVTLIPKYMFFSELNLLGSLNAFILPAITGQGLNSAIFILIFYQFFRRIPKSLEEAAMLDGAGHFRIFLRISVPMVGPAFLISFLFSFVWYWNETYLASLYFGNELTTLPLQLQKFVETYQAMFASSGSVSINEINEGIRMAGTLLSILPLLIVYFITQRWFVEGVERTGITGE